MAGTVDSVRVPRARGRGAARRRRPALLTFATLGVVVGLLGVAGVFATSSDRATTGTNDARSGDVPAPAPDVDVQLTTATFNPVTRLFVCGTDWVEDLQSGVVTSDGTTLDEQTPGVTGADVGAFCIRNRGADKADLSASIIDVVDQELACSAGEAVVDAACGSGVGELSGELKSAFYSATAGSASPSNCQSQASSLLPLRALADGGPRRLTTLASGEVRGYCARVVDPALSPAAQTDRVTWRYALDATLWVDPFLCIEDDEYEPNNTMFQATGSLDLNTHLVAETCTDQDDWINVVSTSATPAVFTLRWFDSYTKSLTAYRADGTVVASGTTYVDPANPTLPQLRITVAPRDVRYLKVSEVRPLYSPSSYWVELAPA